MKYSNLISRNKGFQYSINLQYDLHNIHKVEGYIPSIKSVEILKEYLLNIYSDNKDKATVLIGPYGKGKSHLLLVLLSLLRAKGEEEQNIIKELIAKIKNIDKECAVLAEDVTKNKKLIPIIINSNSIDLNQAFLIAIRESLTSCGLTDILPKTYFDVAVDTIDKWEREYPATYEILEKEISSFGANLNVVEFRKLLRKCNKQAFDMFKDIYPKVTSGAEFNPLINTDVIKLYEEVAHLLLDKTEYSGLYIVFDEFSKFIEASVTHNTSRDLKILQDLAELANRSSKSQIHLTCITHKTINEYISRVPAEKIDAWRAIEGRFKEVYFTSSTQQNYELIANAIIKNKSNLEEFINENKEYFESIADSTYEAFKNVYNKEEYKEQIVYGCFPLNPYTTYTLPKISEKVAQNERTLFTFLCKEENNSLNSFVESDHRGLELLNLNKLYDYFEVLFKKEIFNEAVNSVWIKADTALRYCEEEIQKSIIKALAVIYINNDFVILPPANETVRSSLALEKSDFEKAISLLESKGVIIYRKSTNFIDFVPMTGINLNQKVNNIAATKIKNINLSNELTSLTKLGYILPKRYNDKYTMVRFFKKAFMTSNEFLAYESAESLINDNHCDGIIVNLIYIAEEEKQLVEKKLYQFNDKRVILVLPNANFELEEEVRKYLAINMLLEDQDFLSEDVAIENYLDILKEDTIINIRKYINEIYDVEGTCCVVKTSTGILDNLNISGLSKVTSEICEEIFDRTPKVNNELINKNTISSPILKVRNSIVENILTKEYLTFESKGTSAESTIFRATVKNKGLLDSQVSEDLLNVINEIREFFGRAENEVVSFRDLYGSLIGTKSGIGMRKGIIPIYIAYVISNIQQEIIVYLNGRKPKELSLSTELLNNINDNPQNYSIKIELGTKEKEDYIIGLKSLLEDHIDNKKYALNKYSEIVKGLQTWIQSLSKYARTHALKLDNEELEDDIKKLRKSVLKFDINVREFVYRELLKITKADSYSECLNRIHEIKEYLNSFDNEVKQYVINKTKEVLNPKYSGSLTQGFIKWADDLTEAQKEYLYDNATNRVMKLIGTNINDINLINKLADITTGLSIEDWDDYTIKEYLEEISRIKNTVEQYTEEVAIAQQGGLVKISVQSEGGIHEEKSFNVEEMDGISMMLLNNLEDAIDEYGGAITDNQKRNILVKILEKYI